MAALALVLAGFWFVSQLTVATWLAREAGQRQADWSQGLSPWRWDFRDPSSVVRHGSHGLDAATLTPDGLDITLPDDGVASLSLNLRGAQVDAGAVRRVHIEANGDAPLRMMLLAGADGAISTWIDVAHAPGWRAQDADLPALDALRPGALPPLQALHLRIESAPGARLRLHRLELRALPCTAPACPGHRLAAPPFATPERLLAHRDRALAQWPALAIEAGGWFGAAGRGLAGLVQPLPALWRGLPGAAALLILFALARRRAARRMQPEAFFHPCIELALALGLPLALLLAGWPARETPAAVTLAFAGSLLALALFPIREPVRWRWLGDRHAWAAALIFTALAVLMTAPLGAIDGGTATARDPSRILRYPLWALLQQGLLLAAIAPRLRQLVPDERLAALACGTVFGLLHAPNLALMIFTLIGGTAWAWLGWRHRALLPLAASHAVLGLWLTHIAPTWLLRSAEIGARYLMAP